MEYRNAKYNSAGGVDCEINHPVYGWIPTTLSSDDALTSDLLAKVMSEIVPLEYTESDALRIANINEAIRNMLATLIIGKGYDTAEGYAKYVGYANPYRLDAENLGKYEASVWDYAEQELAKFNAGTRTLPTPEEFLLELPQFVELT